MHQSRPTHWTVRLRTRGRGNGKLFYFSYLTRNTNLAENPYQSPDEPQGGAALSRPRGSDAATTQENIANLRFTSGIVRAMSIFCGLAAAFSLLSLIAGFYYTGFYGDWTWVHTLNSVRGLAVPAFAILCRFSWYYASSLKALANSLLAGESLQLKSHVENLTWLWIGLTLLPVCKILDLAAQLSLVLSYSKY